MKRCNHILTIGIPALIMCLTLTGNRLHGQETRSDYTINSPFHNQLFFNRFLINPTFSLVRENKSYLNILHRNQYASYEDNIQNYYLGFSNKVNERTALGIGVYGQWEGVVQEFGFNANYATSVPLGDKTRLSFGTNITYVSQGLAKNRIIIPENDPTLQEAENQSQIALQPGMALSVGRFDIGVYATNLIRYNQSTNELLTGFNTNNLKASLQYTHLFEATRGLFANARLMPLLQMGRNEDDQISYIGSLLLDLPDYGWFQTAYDQTYGLSMGLGFNLNQKLSLGYLMEKDLSDAGANLGWNHELSLAYTFKEDQERSGIDIQYVDGSKDAQIDQIVKNYEEQILELRAEQQSSSPDAQPGTLAFENRLILDELMLRMDSIEEARTAQFEQRFETLVRTLRNEIRKQGPAADPAPRIQDRRVQTAVAATKPAEPKPYVPVAKRDFNELPIKAKNRSDIVGVSSGYYLIANVYSNKKYLNAFLKECKEKGLDARQFYNTENGLYYVYLADFNTKTDAKTAVVSDLGGQYREEKWIMQVYNPVATADVSYEDQ